MKVGDILTYAYHYNARYPQFVRITRMTDKTVWLEKLEKKWVTDDGYGQNGTRVPDLDKPAKAMNKSFRIKRFKNGEEFLTVDSCWCHVWDGKPEDEWTD